MDVCFSKLSEVKFKTITPDDGTFYLVSKPDNKYDFYIGSQKLNNIDDIAKYVDIITNIFLGSLDELTTAIEEGNIPNKTIIFCENDTEYESEIGLDSIELTV